MESNSLFSKIVTGEIPAAKIYENEDVLAFLDIAPVAKGHTLIIPKKNYPLLEDLPENLVAPIMLAAQKVVRMQKKALGSSGSTLLQNNGKSAGQEVFHFHLHIIPRFKNDGHQWGRKSISYDDNAEMLNLANRMRDTHE